MKYKYKYNYKTISLLLNLNEKDIKKIEKQALIIIKNKLLEEINYNKTK